MAKPYRGFTLAELIIAVGVSTLLISLSPTYGMQSFSNQMLSRTITDQRTAATYAQLTSAQYSCWSAACTEALSHGIHTSTTTVLFEGISFEKRNVDVDRVFGENAYGAEESSKSFAPGGSTSSPR